MTKAKDIINMMEMASLQPRDTGTLLPIWIDEVGKERKGKHNTPRLRVHYEGKYIPVSIEADPKILAGSLPDKYFSALSAWISLNLDILMKHWNREITTMELFRSVKKLD